jgi:hypothetical protein
VLNAENDKALAAIREALAEQEKREPVAIGDEWKPCMKLPIVVHVREQREGETHVSTREGITPILPTDLIMRGVAGEEYPIGYELFNKTYTFEIAAPVDAKAIREERDSMWLAQMEFEQKRVRAEVEAEWIETNKALAKEIIEQRNQYLDMLAEAVDLSVKAEREACAKVCDEEAKGFEQAHLWDEEYAVKNCAAAIRGLK